ncbi:MAG: DMP19 family protein [Planctomycetes bacterium]|nr:DMP19 family protein [Planctomycetota bacterium]
MRSYPDSVQAVSRKHEIVGWDGLSEADRLVYCLWSFENEIDNGGFQQFFTSPSVERTDEILEALRQIGALKTRALAERAIQVVFGKEGVPPGPEERRAALEPPTAEERKQLTKVLYELDRKFFLHEDDIAALVNRWLKRHRTGR